MATYYGAWKQINSADAYRVVLVLTEDTTKSDLYSICFNYDLQMESKNNFCFSDYVIGRYLSIENTVAVNVPYNSSSSERMSVGQNTTTTIAKGSVKVNRTAISLTIDAYLETGTMAYYLPGRITLSGTWDIDWTAAGGATVNSITDNGNNTITIVTTMGADGTNNKVSNVHLYGFVNKTTGDPSVHDNDFFASGDEAYGTISGREVTFRIPISSMKNPPTTSPYTVRVRAYSISNKGDNPGGTSINSGNIFIRETIKVYGNNDEFQLGDLYASPNQDGDFKAVTGLYYKDKNNTWNKIC